MQPANLQMIASIVIAASFYALATQLVYFASNTKVLDIFKYANNSLDSRRLYSVMISHFGVQSLLVVTCATTFLLEFLLLLSPDVVRLQRARLVILTICAVLTAASAVLSFKFFPLAVELLGELHLTDSYLVEVVEMVKESIVEIAEDYKIVRGNEASKDLFSMPEVVGACITDLIHPDDLRTFQDAASTVLSSFTSIPVTIEYRIQRKSISPVCRTPTSAQRGKRNNFFSRTSNGSNKIHATTESDDSRVDLERGTLVPQSTNTSFLEIPLTPAGESSLKTSDHVEYIWIESTICKGICQQKSLQKATTYDLKMVSRNIDDRKKEAINRFQNIVRETEERTRTNAAKLRYLSCIAHDLKTPLQSFSFSLDLLNHTRLLPEQQEFVQQANVAVDLMKLTISQTMDISKALTGAKLMPRRTTVFLSSVIQRVEVIINGYGKQVPVYFQVPDHIIDSIITDEEWLWQMILNLLTNACKYTDRGEIRVVLSLSHAAITPHTPRNSIHTGSNSSYTPTALVQEMLLVEVIDTGVGVSSEKLSGMFDAFSQVQEGQVTGTGLGLFGVRTRAEGLLGSCGARHNTESSTGTGTVMWFAIPYVPDEVAGTTSSSDNVSRVVETNSRRSSLFSDSSHIPGHLTSPPTGSIASPSSVGTTRVRESPSPEDVYKHGADLIRRKKLTAMVVEDTITVRKLMEKLLLKMGFESVVCYENGSKGLNALMEGTVDIVFSDVQMPIMTGPEMVSRFRRFETTAMETGTRLRRQLVVAVTANGSENGEFGTAGFDEICHKPLGMQDIYQIVIKYF